MKLYLLTRLDQIDWDEYTGFVIIAETPKEAKNIAIEAEDEEMTHDWKCTLISRTVEPNVKSGVILSSFSAG